MINSSFIGWHNLCVFLNPNIWRRDWPLEIFGYSAGILNKHHWCCPSHCFSWIGIESCGGKKTGHCQGCCIFWLLYYSVDLQHEASSLQLEELALWKMMVWTTILSFWDGNFWGGKLAAKLLNQEVYGLSRVAASNVGFSTCLLLKNEIQHHHYKFAPRQSIYCVADETKPFESCVLAYGELDSPQLVLSQAPWGYRHWPPRQGAWPWCFPNVQPQWYIRIPKMSTSYFDRHWPQRTVTQHAPASDSRMAR